MKRIILVLTVLCLAFTAGAQTWDEWFRQKKTKIKYLVEQIFALKMYGNAVSKGYDVVNKGLQNIGHLKESDLNLHQDHFASLLLVNTRIHGGNLYQRIKSLQAVIQVVTNECRNRVTKDREFSLADKEYFIRVLENAGKESKAIGVEVVMLITDRQLQMNDDERLKRLQTLRSNMEDVYVYVKRFKNDLSVSALNRMKEQAEAKRLKSFF